MSAFEKYNLILCILTFVALTATFGLLLTRDVRNTFSMIRGGLLDEELKKRRLKREAKRNNKAVGVILDYCLPSVILLILIALFVFSLATAADDKKPVGNIAQAKVVESGSMSKKNEKNEYLFKNELGDQVDRFDLVFIEKLPAESELKLYDVVIYEYEGNLILHRIVGIEEPDENHSERTFVLQGDANRYPDSQSVSYTQMRGIYRGKRIKFVGSFVVFMRSPAGFLCILLLVVVCFVYPLLEKRMEKAESERLAVVESEKER